MSIQKGQTAMNSRTREYFGYDPAEIIDDLVAAVSAYQNESITSLEALLTGTYSFPQSEVKRAIQKFKSELLKKLLDNADIFQMYCARNIFQINIDTDLTVLNVTPEQQEKSSIPTASDDSIALNAEMEQLYHELDSVMKEVIQEKEKYQQQLLQHQFYSEIQKRLTEIQKITESIQQLPADQIRETYSKFIDCVQQMSQIQRPVQRQSIQELQASFKFDP